MKYNDTIEVQVVTEPTTEPVSLTEVKRHLNLQFDTSGSYVFDDDDTYLTDLITQCRQAVEQWIGVSLAEKTLKAILRNECGNVDIPFGPVTAIASVKDEDGNTIASTDYKILGNQFKWIVYPCYPYLEVDYDAGYDDTNIPASLKRAILEEIAFRYAHRGDGVDSTGICKGAMELAAPFTRKSLVA